MTDSGTGSIDPRQLGVLRAMAKLEGEGPTDSTRSGLLTETAILGEELDLMLAHLLSAGLAHCVNGDQVWRVTGAGHKVLEAQAD